MEHREENDNTALLRKTIVRIQCSHANENALWGWLLLYTNIEDY